MKSLIYNGERLEAEKIIKKTDAIIGYIGDTEVFSFKGISDWSIFAIEGGDFDPDLEAEREQRITDLEAAVAAILGGALG